MLVTIVKFAIKVIEVMLVGLPGPLFIKKEIVNQPYFVQESSG